MDALHNVHVLAWVAGGSAAFLLLLLWVGMVTIGERESGLVVRRYGRPLPPGRIIAIGTPGDLTTVACAPRTAETTVVAGTTYYVLVFDDSGSGGNLQLSMSQGLPVPTLSLTINPGGTVDKTGAAHIAGSRKWHRPRRG